MPHFLTTSLILDYIVLSHPILDLTRLSNIVGVLTISELTCMHTMIALFSNFDFKRLQLVHQPNRQILLIFSYF